MKGVTDPIELWKAIHGGCWPGPPIDTKFNRQVNDVISGLALFNFANTFVDARVAQQTRTLAAASLNNSLATLQKAINAQVSRGTRGRALTPAQRRRITTLAGGVVQA